MKFAGVLLPSLVASLSCATAMAELVTNSSRITHAPAWSLTSAVVGCEAISPAKCWYVDGSIGNSGNGTSWATAWKSVSNVTGVGAGDVVYISGGTKGTTLTYSGIETWKPDGGTSQKPVTYKIAQDDAHNGTAIFDGTIGNLSNWFAYPNYNTTPASNVSNIIISGDAADGAMHLKVTGYNNLLVGDAALNVRLSYIDFGHTNSDLRFIGGSGIEIDHCYLYKTDGGSDHAMVLDLAGASWDVNKIHDNTIYLPSTFSGTGDDGIQDGSSGISLYHNTIVGYKTNYTGGQHQDGWQSTGGTSYIKIYDNTFINLANYAVFGDAYYGGFSHMRVYNNIVVLNSVDLQGSPPPQGIVVGVDGGALGRFAFNDIVLANNTVVDYVYSNLLDPTLPNGEGRGSVVLGSQPAHPGTFTNSIVANNASVNSAVAGTQDISSGVSVSNNVVLSSAEAMKVLVHYSKNDPSNDLHPLSSANKLIDHGKDLSAYFITDYAGFARPQGAAWDVGAYEYNAMNGDTKPQAPSKLRIVQ